MTVYTHFFIKLFSASSIHTPLSPRQTQTPIRWPGIREHGGLWQSRSVFRFISASSINFIFFSFFEHLCDCVSGVVCAQGLPTHVRSIQVLHVLAHNFHQNEELLFFSLITLFLPASVFWSWGSFSTCFGAQTTLTTG